MGCNQAGSVVVDFLELVGQAGSVAGAELDRLKRRRVVLGTEAYDKALVLQIACVLLEHGGGVAGGDEFH